MEIGLFPKAIVGGGCVVKGTKILTDTGIVEIQDIKVGDKVLTSDNYEVVTHTWTPETLVEGNPECIKIEFEDGTSVTCSEDHPFLVQGDWVPAQELTLDTEVSVV
jgi:intein/homing endonuclease